MSVTGANGFQFDGCLSWGDMGVQRKPYHKNCKCALHKSRRSTHCTRHSDCDKVSFPIRRSWSEGCLALLAHAAPLSNQSSPGSGSGSPAEVITRTQTQLVLCLEDVQEEEEEEIRSSTRNSLSISELN